MVVSSHDFRLWEVYTKEEWHSWVRELPERGQGGYSPEQWLQWVILMTEMQQALDKIPPQQRSESPPPGRAGKTPAQWRAKSESKDSVVRSEESPSGFALASTPAQGPLPPGCTKSSVRPVIPLQGANAKEKKKLRSVVRQEAWLQSKHRDGARFQSTLSKAPPICNRVASGWGVPAIACHCDEWPQFLADNKDKNHLAITIDGCGDADGLTKTIKVGDHVCYWRPGSKDHKWWYNGKVESLQWVQFPSGKHAPVMGIN